METQKINLDGLRKMIRKIITESVNKKDDFIVIDNQKHLVLYPQTQLGGDICQDYNGILMKKFAIPTDYFDTFIKKYSDKYNTEISYSIN